MANIPKPVDMTQKDIPFLKVGGTTKVITNAESGCFFRAGVNFEYYTDLLYDELKKDVYDITTQASVNIGVFADDIFGYVADIWNKYYSEDAVNYYEENKGDSGIKGKFHRKFSRVANIPNGRKVQLAIGFKPLLSADAYLGGSFTNAKWGKVTWVQYNKKIINDQIHYQKDYICGCHKHNKEKKYSRIDDASWCYPGGTKDTHKKETFKSLNIDEYTTFEVDTIPCNYKGITWTIDNSGYRFGAIHLKVLARIEHDGKKDRYFSGDFDGSPNFDKAKLADKPNAKKDEWDVIGEKVIIFNPVDCRYPYQTEFRVKNYYNAPIGIAENSEFEFTSELKKIYNNGPRCEVQIRNNSVELRRKFDYLYEEKYQQDTVVNDNAGGLWLQYADDKGFVNNRWYNLFTRESAGAQGLKKAHFKTDPRNGSNRTIKFTIGRYGTFYSSMEYEKTLELTPKDVSKTPNITIKNTIDPSGNIKRVATLKSVPSNMCVFLKDGNKWKKYYKNPAKKTTSVYNQDFHYYNESTYSFRYVSFTVDEKVSYPLIYNEATFEVKPPNIDLTMTNKGSESLDNSIKLGDEVEYEIKASGDIDGDDTLDNIINLKYRLYIKKQNNITIKSIDGEPAVLGINSDYYISKESLNKHTVTIVFDKYTPSSGSNNDIEVQFYGKAQYGNGNASIDLKDDDDSPFKAYFEFPHLFHQNNVDKPSVQLRTVYIKDNKVIPIYPIIISKPTSPSAQSNKLGGSENS